MHSYVIIPRIIERLNMPEVLRIQVLSVILHLVNLLVNLLSVVSHLQRSAQELLVTSIRNAEVYTRAKKNLIW